MTPHERLSCRVTPRLTVPSLHCGPSAPPTASQAFVPGGDWDGPVLYINTGWDQTERHHSKKVLARPIPLNYQVRHEIFSFFLPHFPGAPRSERLLLPRRAGALWEGPVPFGRNRESRSREAAGRRNWPEAVPRKIRGKKKTAYPNQPE
jgi:hypothetical protein